MLFLYHLIAFVVCSQEYWCIIVDIIFLFYVIWTCFNLHIFPHMKASISKKTLSKPHTYLCYKYHVHLPLPSWWKHLCIYWKQACMYVVRNDKNSMSDIKPYHTVDITNILYRYDQRSTTIYLLRKIRTDLESYVNKYIFQGIYTIWYKYYIIQYML